MIVAVTGSVATIKILDIVKQIKQFAEVNLIVSKVLLSVLLKR